jgi:hypothetical protein
MPLFVAAGYLMTVGGIDDDYTDAVELHDIDEPNTLPECHEPGKDTSLRKFF